jgi:hypothetical protein
MTSGMFGIKSVMSPAARALGFCWNVPTACAVMGYRYERQLRWLWSFYVFQTAEPAKLALKFLHFSSGRTGPLRAAGLWWRAAL